MFTIGRSVMANAGDWHAIFSRYKKYVSKKDTVLEIGASTVNSTKRFAQYCKKLFGVELFEERMPRNFKNIHYLNGDWQALTKIIKPESIDVAISTHTLEHVQDDLRAINELFEILKREGVALINTPNRKRLSRRIIEMFTGEKKFPHLEHVREYSEEDLVKLLKKSRFKKFTIIPVIFGIQNGYFCAYSQWVPTPLRRLANVWEIHLFKE